MESIWQTDDWASLVRVIPTPVGHRHLQSDVFLSWSDDRYAILSNGRTESPIMLICRSVWLNSSHLVLPAEWSENAFAIFCLSGAEPVLQTEVTLANAVAATASVYNDDLSKTHVGINFTLSRILLLLLPRVHFLIVVVKPWVATDTCVPLRPCFLAERDPVQVLHAHWSIEWNSPESW